MTKTDTNVPELVINTLTNAEYEAAKQAGEISSTELYMTTDDPDYITEDQLENTQDLLISGTNIKTINNQSLLGSGNIDIQGGGSSTAEEIVNANEATGATSPLKVWQGTEQEYNQGESTNWYNWENENGLTAKRTLDNISFNKGIVYSNNIYLAQSWNDSTYYTSTDLQTWTQRTFPDTFNHKVIVGNDLFCFCPWDDVTSNKCYFSSDGINWVEKTFSTSDERLFYFAGNKFFAEAYNLSSVSEPSQLMYTNGLDNWESCNITSSKTVFSISYGNNIYVCAGQYVAYSTDGINWINSSIVTNQRITTFFKNKFFTYDNHYNLYYSSDGSQWTGTGFQPSSNIYGGTFVCTDNIFMITSDLYVHKWTSSDGINWVYSSNKPLASYVQASNKLFFQRDFTNKLLYYSADGNTWNTFDYSSSEVTWSSNSIIYDKNLFMMTSNPASKLLIMGSPSVYTLDQEPTTSSTVYSAPSTESALTITAVDTTNNTITLSDNNVYNRNSAEDTETYRSIGEVHPDYICNINNVGVKIGNITIADNTTLDTVPIQGSTNAITSGAVYEVLGNLETALYNFNSRTE